MDIIRDTGERRVVTETGDADRAVAVLRYIDFADPHQAVARLLVAGETIAFGTVDECHAIRHLFDRSRIAQVAHHRQIRLVATQLAGTVHLRNRQHRAVAVQRQLFQCTYIAADHLFLRLASLAFAAQEVQVVHDHQVAFPQTALQHGFRTYLFDGSPGRIVEI